jgi:hypothetical protein
MFDFQKFNAINKIGGEAMDAPIKLDFAPQFQKNLCEPVGLHLGCAKI